MKNKRESAKCR